jgi:serine/threonine protein kinase
MSTPPQKLEKYELRQPLGRGNVGEVWKGYDSQHGYDVAVKILHTDLQSDPHFLNRFLTEGKKVASLHHENIVPVYDVAVNTQEQANNITAYIASEFIEGQTLAQYLASAHTQGTRLSLHDIVYLFTSLGVAIDYAHKQGVIHGNIKPANILLDKHHTERFTEGEPMLTDFGMPLLLGNTASVGDPYYMSPEQARGDALNNRSDVYSLGVVLYELCTGVKPFRDESSVAVMMQHINTLPMPPTLLNAQIPPALSEVILRAMAKDTASRYAMASLLATAIADACSIRPPLPLPQMAVAEEATSYKVPSGQRGSFLGVSQPTGPNPTISRPLPAAPRLYTSPRLPATPPSTPRPTTTQQSGPLAPLSGNQSGPPTPLSGSQSGPLTSISGKHRIIQPTPAPITRKIPTPLPIPAQNTIQQQRVVPQNAASVISQAYIPTDPAPPLPTTPLIRPPLRRRSRVTDIPMYAIFAAAALVLLIIAGVIGTVILNSKGADVVVGHVLFQDDALGHDDTLRLDLQNIDAPAQGKTYQAWLQDTQHHTLALGTVAVNNTTATLLYNGNLQHSNLVALTQAIIVTTENAGNASATPQGNVVYKATFDSLSAQYIKNILYQTPGMPNNNSVVFEMLNTIKSINDKAGSLVDSINGTHDYALAKRQAIRILELVDGTNYAKASGDLPKNIPSQVQAQLGILSSPAQAGYLDLLATQLDKVQANSGNNAAIQQHVQNVRNAITDLRTWMQQLRNYVVPLVQAKNIADPALANGALQVQQLASDSYTGRTLPPNDGPRPIAGSAGVYIAYLECQYLSTLDVKKVS